MSLQGQSVFITGGSSGIGLGIARACLEEGMKVAITYRTQAHLEQAKEELDESALAIAMDVRNKSALEKAAAEVADQLGPLNLLVCNAGVGFPGSILQSSREQWDYALSVNLMGVVDTIRAFVPSMIAHGGPAHVVATASMSGLFAAGGAGVYTTSKFAVVGLMEALKNELSDAGVGVSILCPGIVQSRIADWKRSTPFESEEATKLSLADTGIEPLEYGRLVLEGVRNKALYILTHPEYREGLEKRCQALQQSFSAVDSEVPEARRNAAQRVLSSPIYEEEIQRVKGGADNCAE